MRRLLFLALALMATAPAPMNRIRFTVRCIAGTKTLYEADVDGPAGTDFAVHLDDKGFALDATFVNEPTANGVDVRASLATRRQRGSLWDLDAQQHRFNVRFDQEIEMLPFGGAGRAGLLKFDILPQRSSGSGPMSIRIHDVSNGAIRVDAWREPHWYDVEIGNERGRVFAGEESRVAGHAITLRPAPHADPWRLVDVSVGHARGVVSRDVWQDIGALHIRVTPKGDSAPDPFALLDQAFDYANSLGPKVWPGFAANDAPVILIDGEHEYLLNSDGAEGFTKTSQTFRGHPVFERKRVFPPGLQASFPAIGRATVVIGTPEGTKTAPDVWPFVVVHELFHVFTFEHGEIDKVAALNLGPKNDASWQLNYPFPYEDARVRQAVRDVARDPSRETLDALRALISPKDYAYFRFVVTKEGVARYVENRVRQLNGLVPRSAEIGDTISRSDFYTVGDAMARKLDETQPKWKETYFDRDVWLDSYF